jgi:hypothetical protein
MRRRNFVNGTPRPTPPPPQEVLTVDEADITDEDRRRLLADAADADDDEVPINRPGLVTETSIRLPVDGSREMNAWMRYYTQIRRDRANDITA